MEASAETDDVIRLNLPRVLTKRELERVCCIEQMVVDQEYKYVIVTNDCFYILLREQLTGKAKKLAEPTYFRDVTDVVASTELPTLFEDDALNERSKHFWVSFAPPADMEGTADGKKAVMKASKGKVAAAAASAGEAAIVTLSEPDEDENGNEDVSTTTLEIYSFAKNSVVLFYFRWQWIAATRVRRMVDALARDPLTAP